jgi:hypothetical protein
LRRIIHPSQKPFVMLVQKIKTRERERERKSSTCAEAKLD